MSCRMFCFCFFCFLLFCKKKKKKSSGYQDMEGGGVCCFPVGFVPPVSSVGLCEKSKVRAPHKAAAFHLISDSCFFGRPAVNRRAPP